MKKQAYYTWFVGQPGPGGLLQRMPTIEETAALLASESTDRTTSVFSFIFIAKLTYLFAASDLNGIRHYGSHDHGTSRRRTSKPNGVDTSGDVEECEHQRLTSDEEDEGEAKAADLGVGFMGVSLDEPKPVREYAAEAWNLLKLVTAKFKESMLALLYLVWKLLLHESHKYHLPLASFIAWTS